MLVCGVLAGNMDKNGECPSFVFIQLLLPAILISQSSKASQVAKNLTVIPVICISNCVIVYCVSGGENMF